MSRYALTAQAEADLRDIWSYIAADNPAAARAYIIRLFDRFTSIATHPAAFRVRRELTGNFRACPADNHLILYRALNDRVEIVRVIHQRRRISENIERD